MALLNTKALQRQAQFVQSTANWNAAPGTDNILKIYKGALPGTADGFNPAAHASDELISLNNWTLIEIAEAVVFDAFPDEFTIPTQTGTAAWYAIYNNATLSGSPALPDKVILGEVTEAGGSPITDGTLKIIDLSLVSGSPGISIGPVTLNIDFVGV